jgi:beta-lactamase regulating signal transducer with metallopeptidase domain
MLAFSEMAVTAVRWLGAALLNGTMFAALAWLASATCLRSASARLLSVLWLLSLVQFVWWRPFTGLALPLSAATVAAPQPGATITNGPALWALAYVVFVACMLARFTWRHIRLRRSLLQLPAADASLLASVRAAANILSVRSLPDVRVTQEGLAPFSIGPMRPILVLPHFLCEPGQRLHAVLLHELAHIARRDHAVLWFERAVRSMFFFWPPVHFISRKLDEARELACDERAIARGGLCPIEYARILVDVVALTRPPLGTDALAIGRTAWRLERRVERLLAQPWSTSLRSVHFATVLLLMAAALVGLRIEPLRASSGNASNAVAPPACDGSAMSELPPPAAHTGEECDLQCSQD